MKTPINEICQNVEEFISSPATTEEKAWGVIHDFYHLLLTYMEAQHISKADLSKRLGKSRSAVTQMFNKTPNISLKKMVEIAEAIGLDIRITSPQVERGQERPKRFSTLSLSIQDNMRASQQKPQVAV